MSNGIFGGSVFEQSDSPFVNPPARNLSVRAMSGLGKIEEMYVRCPRPGEPERLRRLGAKWCNEKYMTQTHDLAGYKTCMANSERFASSVAATERCCLQMGLTPGIDRISLDDPCLSGPLGRRGASGFGDAGVLRGNIFQQPDSPFVSPPARNLSAQAMSGFGDAGVLKGNIFQQPDSPFVSPPARNLSAQAMSGFGIFGNGAGDALVTVDVGQPRTVTYRRLPPPQAQSGFGQPNAWHQLPPSGRALRGCGCNR